MIATDVESDASGKALGARRALALLAEDGPLPRTWHTVGDSRSDYAMADHLHGLGYEVTHVDVGPQPPLPDRPYAVTTVPGLGYEAAGEAHLATAGRRSGRLTRPDRRAGPARRTGAGPPERPTGTGRCSSRCRSPGRTRCPCR